MRSSHESLDVRAANLTTICPYRSGQHPCSADRACDTAPCTLAWYRLPSVPNIRSPSIVPAGRVIQCSLPLRSPRAISPIRVDALEYLPNKGLTTPSGTGQSNTGVPGGASWTACLAFETKLLATSPVVTFS